MKDIIFITVALAALCACHNSKESSAQTGEMPVEVSQPVIKDITLTREYPGYLDADATVSIVGRVNGIITSRSATDGSRVKKGELLFVIEPTLYENAVSQAEAALKTAEAELEYAQNNYERMQVAINSNAVSQIELLQAKSNVESCKAAVKNASAALGSAKTKLGYCYIKAPADGVVSRHSQPVGAYIAGEMNPVELCRLYKDDIMYAYFNMNSDMLQHIGNDIDSITFSQTDDPTRQYSAAIDYLAPDINLNTGTVQVRAKLENSNGDLKPGNYIKVALPYREIEKAILIDDASIGTDQLGKYIYVVNDSSIIEYRRIEVGRLVDDTLRLVTAGLQPSERYVTKALLKVRNGMKVTPIAE